MTEITLTQQDQIIMPLENDFQYQIKRCKMITMAETLDKLSVGDVAFLEDLSDNLPFFQRLKDLGFTKGASVQVVRKSLFGDPIQLQIRSSQFAIRKSDAKNIKVSRLNTQDLAA